MKGTRRGVLLGVLMVLVGAGTVIALAGYRESGGPTGSPAAEAPAERVMFQVANLRCGSCEGKIRNALGALSAVRVVGVDVGGGTVTVQYARGSLDPKVLGDTLTELGYPARYVASGAVPMPAGRSGSGAGCGGNCCSSQGAGAGS